MHLFIMYLVPMTPILLGPALVQYDKYTPSSIIIKYIKVAISLQITSLKFTLGHLCHQTGIPWINQHANCSHMPAVSVCF